MMRIIISMIIISVPALGMNPLGARAVGMGGAQVALVDDLTAAFWNPAAFGLQDTIFSTDTVLGFTLSDNLTYYIDELDAFYGLKDELPDNYNDFMEYITSDNEEAHRYLDDVLATLNAFNDPGVGVVWDIHTGVATKVGPLVFSWLNENHLEVGPWVDAHISRLIPSEYLQSPNNVLALYEEGLLTDEELNLLWPGYDPLRPDISTFVGDKPDNDIGLEENGSIITFNDLSMNHLGVSYGYAFELGREQYLSFGASLKYVYAERRGNSFDILPDSDISNFNPDILDIGSNWLLNNLFTLEPIATGGSFSLDIGVMGKLEGPIRFGLLARNIIPTEITWNDPRFRPTPISPELRLGAAYELWKGFNLALDLDILAVDSLSSVYNSTTGVEEDAVQYRKRNLALGAEWAIVPGLILRAGMFTNYNAIFEESSPASLNVTAGVGLNIGGVFKLSLAIMGSLVTPENVDADLGGSFSMGFTL